MAGSAGILFVEPSIGLTIRLNAMRVTHPREQVAQLNPIGVANRIALLDVLRGFALYGVLLGNTAVWFNGLAFLPRNERRALSTNADELAASLIRLFVDGKAMTLFAFLFGVGFAIQLGRAASRGRSGVPVYLRRLAILFAIGMLHVVLLWWGDILWGYALAGFAMVLFRRQSQRALLVWAVVFILLPQMVATIPAVVAVFGHLPGPVNRTAFRAQVLDALRGHDPFRLAQMQVTQALVHVSRGPFFFIPWTLGRFLLGYVVGRSRLLHEAGAYRPLFRKLLVVALGLGSVCSVASFLAQRFRSSGGTFSLAADIGLMVPDEIGYLAVAAAYVAALALLMQRSAWRRRLLILAPAGQMALSNYLLQSLICTFVFYGWGLGLIGRVGPALCVPLTLAIFVVQIVFSVGWLRRFRFGPAEWVWRSLTYGHRQPMLRPRAHVPCT